MHSYTLHRLADERQCPNLRLLGPRTSVRKMPSKYISNLLHWFLLDMRNLFLDGLLSRRSIGPTRLAKNASGSRLSVPRVGRLASMVHMQRGPLDKMPCSRVGPSCRCTSDLTLRDEQVPHVDGDHRAVPSTRGQICRRYVAYSLIPLVLIISFFAELPAGTLQRTKQLSVH